MMKEEMFNGAAMLLGVFIGTLIAILLAVILIRFFVTPTVSDKAIRQERLNVQRRCEDEFAMWPKQRGKILIEGIKKCRSVAGLEATGGVKR